MYIENVPDSPAKTLAIAADECGMTARGVLEFPRLRRKYRLGADFDADEVINEAERIDRSWSAKLIRVYSRNGCESASVAAEQPQPQAAATNAAAAAATTKAKQGKDAFGGRPSASTGQVNAIILAAGTITVEEIKSKLTTPVPHLKNHLKTLAKKGHVDFDGTSVSVR